MTARSRLDKMRGHLQLPSLAEKFIYPTTQNTKSLLCGLKYFFNVGVCVCVCVFVFVCVCMCLFVVKLKAWLCTFCYNLKEKLLNNLFFETKNMFYLISIYIRTKLFICNESFILFEKRIGIVNCNKVP